MNPTNIEGLIDGINPMTVERYANYWFGIRPRNLQEKWQRWVFAFCSIRAGWKANYRAYLSLRQCFPKLGDLRKKLDQSRIGLIERRFRAIGEFTEKISARPLFIEPKVDETWIEWRDRLVKEFYGIGRNKVAFVMEMCYPLECQVSCIDTHMLQLYGVDPKKSSVKIEGVIEAHFIKYCNARSYPPAMVRHILWDQRQNKRNTRYWSFCLEN